ncbi:MAG: DNA methyltransferase [Terriglobia bacterium]
MDEKSICVIRYDQLTISTDRQRKEYTPEDIIALGDSIAKNTLLHPPVITTNAEGKYTLVAGWRRLNAIKYLWGIGETIHWAEYEFAEGELPCTLLSELDSVDAFEIELEENIRREDLSWQDRARATSQLYELRRMQAARAGENAPSVQQIAEEVRGSSGGAFETTRAEILVSRHLNDEDVAGAKTVKDALKILKRKEASAQREELGRRLDPAIVASSHHLVRGDCREILPTLPASSYDVILTDPPYGIDAQNFSDSDGRAGGGTDGGHFYNDSYEYWLELMQSFIPESFRLAKPQAHLYLFCDIERFLELRSLCELAGWKPFRTPLVWHNPTSNRVPWINSGPQRKYQLILYAVKGGRNVTKIYPDLVTIPSDANPGHHAAKPVALYQDLLRRSVAPGDRVLDPFCGSGPVFPAAQEEKVLATGVELMPEAYAIAAKRLEELK